MDNQRGFTLIELICCIALLGILSFIAVPGIMESIDKWILDSTAKEIVEDIRWAQHLAITGHMDYYFDVNISNSYYRIKSRFRNEPTIKRVNFNPNIIDIVCNFESHGVYKRLSFSPTGIPSRTGTIDLKSKRGREATITVAVGTGRVMIKHDK